MYVYGGLCECGGVCVGLWVCMYVCMRVCGCVGRVQQDNDEGVRVHHDSPGAVQWRLSLGVGLQINGRGLLSGVILPSPGNWSQAVFPALLLLPRHPGIVPMTDDIILAATTCSRRLPHSLHHLRHSQPLHALTSAQTFARHM